MPPYKPLLPYFDAVKDLLAKYDTLEFNPKKGDALLEAKGFKKAGGMWQTPDGKPFTLGSHRVSARRARRWGRCCRDAAAARRGGEPEPAAGFQRAFPEGPICRLDLRPWRQRSASRMTRCGCTRARASRCRARMRSNFSRWKNPEYDKIVDEVYVTDPGKRRKAEGAVPRGDGDLAAGPAGHPTGAELSPDPAEHDLLDRTGRPPTTTTSTTRPGT